MNTNQLLKNAASNYGRMVVNIVLTLLMTPFILHRLGNEAYGVWALTQTIAGYFGLTDFGITSAAARYIAHYRALKDWDSLNRVVGSSLCFYIGMSIVSIMVAVVLSSNANRIFVSARGSDLSDMQLLVVNVGLVAAAGFLSILPTQCVVASQRLDVLNRWQLVLQLLAAGATVVGLNCNYGVKAMAFSQLFSAIGMGLCGLFLSRKYCPKIRFYPDWHPETGKTIVSFATYSFVLSLAGRLIYSTDTIVIGAVLSVSAVTGYAIALKFVELMRSVVGAGVGTIGTFVSEQSALEQTESLKNLWLHGSKWSLFVTIPLFAVFLLVGSELITSWVGQSYPEAAAALIFLAFGQTWDLAQSSAYQILLNSGRHRVLSLVTLTEAVANLVLSLILIHHFGVVGVAIGTLIPQLARSIIFYPICMSKVTGLKLETYVKQSIFPAFAASIPPILGSVVFKIFFASACHDRLSITIFLISDAILGAIGVFSFGLSQAEKTKLLSMIGGKITRAVDPVAPDN